MGVLIEHACPLPDRQLGARPVLDRSLKDAARLVARIQHQLDPHLVPVPLLDLVEVAAVGIVRVVRPRAI
jgi:hypothetical protein